MNGGLANAHSNLFIPSTLTGNNFEGSGLNKKKVEENMDIATDVYIDRVNGAPCCGTPVQLFKGGKNETNSQRRQSLLIFLKGATMQKAKLKSDNPKLFQYFEEVWEVRKAHMNSKVPSQYVFVLNLCYKPTCIHPLCSTQAAGTTVKEWFSNGPPLTYIPMPIPDPKRPWGGSCNECPTFCSGHYLKPQDHLGAVMQHGDTQCIYTPPSSVIKNVFYETLKKNQVVSKEKIEEVAKQTLLSLEEVTMIVEHLKSTAERRKEGARKAALTRKKKQATGKHLKYRIRILALAVSYILVLYCIFSRYCNPKCRQ
jgi:hypothetical protein